MKTVMKKMFCLLMVAVLVVGMLPFQASADAGTVDVTIQITGGDIINVPSHVCSSADGVLPEALLNKYVGADWESKYNLGEIQYQTADAGTGEPNKGLIGHRIPVGSTITIFLGVKAEDPCAGVHAYSDATCTAPKTCSRCGITDGAELGHDMVEGVCSRCGYTAPVEQEPVRQAITWQIKNVEGGEVVNSGSFTPNGETAVAKDILYYHVFNKTTAWKDQYSVDKVWSSKQQADVGYNGAIPEGDTVTFVLTPKKSTSEDSGNSGSNITIPSGSKSLKVWANVYVGEVLHDTVLIDTITGLSGDARVYQVITANKANLEQKFPTGYHGMEWVETVYYKVSNNKTAPVDTLMTVGEEDDVFINLYTGEKLVVVNVHTSKTYAVDMNVRIMGFRVGDTVTYDDVLKAVQKYYNVSSMDMYTYDNMQRIIEGKSANKTPYFVVGSGDNVYEVLLSGSRKSGTYTYTADASNPKTGDEIYTPVIVMGASVTALAVLFFLNKKRSII